MISTQIEIAGSPEDVRRVVLDFPRLPEWTQGHIKSIEPVNPESKLEKGDRLKCALQGMTFTPLIVENSSQEFRWRGMLWGIGGLFTGEHSFRFEPSKENPGSTTFIHSENFSGILSFMIAPGTSFATKTLKGFEGFNEDLKAKVESLK